MPVSRRGRVQREITASHNLVAVGVNHLREGSLRRILREVIIQRGLRILEGSAHRKRQAGILVQGKKPVLGNREPGNLQIVLERVVLRVVVRSLQRGEIGKAEGQKLVRVGVVGIVPVQNDRDQLKIALRRVGHQRVSGQGSVPGFSRNDIGAVHGFPLLEHPVSRGNAQSLRIFPVGRELVVAGGGDG